MALERERLHWRRKLAPADGGRPCFAAPAHGLVHSVDRLLQQVLNALDVRLGEARLGIEHILQQPRGADGAALADEQVQLSGDGVQRIRLEELEQVLHRRIGLDPELVDDLAPGLLGHLLPDEVAEVDELHFAERVDHAAALCTFSRQLPLLRICSAVRHQQPQQRVPLLIFGHDAICARIDVLTHRAARDICRADKDDPVVAICAQLARDGGAGRRVLQTTDRALEVLVEHHRRRQRRRLEDRLCEVEDRRVRLHRRQAERREHLGLAVERRRDPSLVPPPHRRLVVEEVDDELVAGADHHRPGRGDVDAQRRLLAREAQRHLALQKARRADQGLAADVRRESGRPLRARVEEHCAVATEFADESRLLLSVDAVGHLQNQPLAHGLVHDGDLDLRVGPTAVLSRVGDGVVEAVPEQIPIHEHLGHVERVHLHRRRRAQLLGQLAHHIDGDAGRLVL
mmetsp:Transcript_4735/g.10760  ORF Transcript_4735/g.10760 Transcript_4735/m.10760 type:complete len:457 (+) Transcript_4735:1196-2566(+)